MHTLAAAATQNQVCFGLQGEGIINLAALVLALAPVATPGLARAPVKVTLTGSSTLAPMMAKLAARFTALNPQVVIGVEAGGSGRGVADARSGKADIGMVSRKLGPGEEDLFAITVARDGAALTVHGDNPVKTLGRSDVVEILTGRITGWKAVGGKDAPIHVYWRTAGHSIREIVSAFFGLKPEAVKAYREVGDNLEAVKTLLEDRDGLAFISVGLVEDEVRDGRPLKALEVDGVKATSATIRDGTYPLSRLLNLVTRSVPTGPARAFIQFVQSREARETILEHGFVPYGK